MTEVLRFNQCDQSALELLLGKLGLTIVRVAQDGEIPGSFWGDDEAGLIQSSIYIRDDTPVHSVLHEACHYVCMDEPRKQTLHTNAGGTQLEENAVCYLQIVLSDCLSDMGRDRMCNDMNSWGYSFRLGTAQAWFTSDSDDAIDWLNERGLLVFANQLTHTHNTAFTE